MARRAAAASASAALRFCSAAALARGLRGLTPPILLLRAVVGWPEAAAPLPPSPALPLAGTAGPCERGGVGDAAARDRCFAPPAVDGSSSEPSGRVSTQPLARTNESATWRGTTPGEWRRPPGGGDGVGEEVDDVRRRCPPAAAAAAAVAGGGGDAGCCCGGDAGGIGCAPRRCGARRGDPGGGRSSSGSACCDWSWSAGRSRGA